MHAHPSPSHKPGRREPWGKAGHQGLSLSPPPLSRVDAAVPLRDDFFIRFIFNARMEGGGGGGSLEVFILNTDAEERAELRDEEKF